MIIKITPDELSVLARHIHEICGIVLDHNKAYLAESRLSPLLEELKLSNYSELYFRARTDHEGKINARIINLISTNETSFFRDRTPFELLKNKLFPEFFSGGARNISIWSAACSTGQEVYTTGIILKELLGEKSQTAVKIVGTDISDHAIAQASYGKYNRIEIERGLPAEKISAYFTEEAGLYKIRDEIRYMASFKKINLLEQFISMGKFDLIFCRNVAIYFSPENRKSLFDRLAYQLNHSGILIIGSTESLFGVSEKFERQEHSGAVYYTLKK